MGHKLVLLALSLMLFSATAIARELPSCNAKIIVKWDFGIEEGYYPDATAYDVDQDNFPRGLAVDAKGNIYVGDGVRYELLKFNSDGKLAWKTLLQSGPKARPELGYVVTAVALGLKNEILVWNRSFERVEIYSGEGNFLRSFPVPKPATNNYSGDSLCVSRNGEVFAFNESGRSCFQMISSYSYEGSVYTLDGKHLRDIPRRKPTDSRPNVDLIGGTNFSISDRRDTSAGQCITIQRNQTDVFTCLGAPQNRAQHHRFDEVGNLYVLLDSGIAVIRPDYANGIVLKDLPNYQRYDCERKFDLTGMTMEKLITIFFHEKRVRSLTQEDPELRGYLLKQEPQDIRLLINAMYARRHFIFNDKKIEKYFKDRFPDYKPLMDDPERAIMGRERENVKYLRDIEETVIRNRKQN